MNIVPEKINLFSIARLSKEKGIARAVRALAKSEREDIFYYIIGDGPEKEEILNIIADKGLKSRIFLLGAKKEPLPFLKNADYLLVPSYNEAAPMVFDEAKALDVPVISTNTTSAEEMLTNINDMICENSEEGLIDVLKKIQKPTRIPSHHATFCRSMNRPGMSVDSGVAAAQATQDDRQHPKRVPEGQSDRGAAGFTVRSSCGPSMLLSETIFQSRPRASGTSRVS